jgi:hypothetical protein
MRGPHAGAQFFVAAQALSQLRFDDGRADGFAV